MKLYTDVAGEQTVTEIPILKTKGGLFDAKIRSFLDAIIEGAPAPVPTSQMSGNDKDLMIRIVKAMATFENGSAPRHEDVMEGFKLSL